MGKKRRKRREREREQRSQAQQHAEPQGHKQEHEKSPKPAPEPGILEKEAITPLGRKTIGGGIVVLIVGFYILTLTDPNGRNWASLLSPLLILGAYAIIGVGIFLPKRLSFKEPTTEKEPETSQLT